MNFETILAINAVSNILCFVAGFYVSHRGLTGVKSDLADVGSDVKNIKARLTPGTTVSVVSPAVVKTPV